MSESLYSSNRQLDFIETYEDICELEVQLETSNHYIEQLKRALSLACETLDNASEGVLYNGEYIMGKDELANAFMCIAKERMGIL